MHVSLRWLCPREQCRGLHRPAGGGAAHGPIRQGHHRRQRIERGRRGLHQCGCCSRHGAGQAVEHGNERAVFCCYCYALSVAAGIERKRLVRRMKVQGAIADAATGAALSMLQVWLSNMAKIRRLLLLLLRLECGRWCRTKETGPSHESPRRHCRCHRECSQHVAGLAVEHGKEKAVFCGYCCALSVAAGVKRKRLVRRMRFRSAIVDATDNALNMWQVWLSNMAKRRRLLLLLLCLECGRQCRTKETDPPHERLRRHCRCHR